MVFVTVGTHEQQFDRLLKAVDKLAETTMSGERFVVQTGYSDYEPKHCEWSRFFPYKKMKSLIDEADVVVTHGGPSSFMEVLAVGKVPVVVPRRGSFDEHVNDHQVEFVRQIFERRGGIEPAYEMDELEEAIRRASKAGGVAYEGHNAEFCDQFALLVDECLHGRSNG